MLFIKDGSKLYYYVFTKDNLLTIVLKIINGIIPSVRTYDFSACDDPPNYKIDIDWIDLYFNLEVGFSYMLSSYKMWLYLIHKNPFIEWERDHFFDRISLLTETYALSD